MIAYIRMSNTASYGLGQCGRGVGSGMPCEVASSLRMPQGIFGFTPCWVAAMLYLSPRVVCVEKVSDPKYKTSFDSERYMRPSR